MNTISRLSENNVAMELGLIVYIVGVPSPIDAKDKYPLGKAKILAVVFNFGIHIEDHGGSEENINTYWLSVQILLCNGELTNEEEKKHFRWATNYIKDELKDDNSLYSKYVLGGF